MFPDSGTAEQFDSTERKSFYMASFGLAPYFILLLEYKLAKTHFVLLMKA